MSGTTRPAPQRLTTVFCFFTIACALIVIAVTVFAFAESRYWLAYLACQFRFQYAAILLVLAAILFALKWRLTAGACCVFAAVNLIAVFGSILGTRDTGLSQSRFRILEINVNYQNQDYERVLKYIRSVDPDYLMLEEYTPEWKTAVSAKLAERLPNKVEVERDDPYGIAVFSRRKIEKQEIIKLAGYGWPSILCEIPFATGRLKIFSTHLVGPMTEAGWTQQTNEGSDLLTRAKHGHSLCICGDFNMTPWTTNFKRLLSVAELRDSRDGYGLQASWPSERPIMFSKLFKTHFRLELAGLNLLVGLPIDHCLVTKDLRVVHREVGPYVGSDHYPVVVDLACPAGSSINR